MTQPLCPLLTVLKSVLQQKAIPGSSGLLQLETPHFLRYSHRGTLHWFQSHQANFPTTSLSLSTTKYSEEPEAQASGACLLPPMPLTACDSTASRAT